MEYIIKIGKSLVEYISSIFFKGDDNVELYLLLDNIGKEEIDNYIDDVIVDIRNEKNMKELECRYSKLVEDDTFIEKEKNIIDDDDNDDDDNNISGNGNILLLV